VPHDANRPGEFVCNRVAARHPWVARAGSKRGVRVGRGDRSPLTSRHAQGTLTTLRLRRCVGRWLVNAGGGGGLVRAISVSRRRINRTRLGAMAETRVNRAKELRFLPVWQGELVYGDSGHRYVARGVCVADRQRYARVVGAQSLVDHWLSGPHFA